jgi:glycosyltransferase involved in cell wall biosynthesis
VTFAGDGPARPSWQASAARLARREPEIRIEFPGWIDTDRIGSLMASADLLVVPSLWPEPFGLVGLEAARHRLPVAAFAVGGIPDWLRPGINGYLAPADPPTPAGLADAIIACLEDPQAHARLRDGAGRVAAEFVFDDHIEALIRVLEDAATVSTGDGTSEQDVPRSAL